jgi:YkoP-like protein
MAVWDSAKHASPAPDGRRWLAQVLCAFDVRQRRRQAVFEYSSDPACIFRLDISRARRPLTLRDGTCVAAGERVARLHFWNEQIPKMPEDGATVGWARRMQRAIAFSLFELARYLAERPDLADVAVICGDVPSATKSQSGQLARIMARYGFETIAEPGRLPVGERLHRFGENILISLIVLANNAGALRPDTLARVRVPIYLSRRILETDFADWTNRRAERELP